MNILFVSSDNNPYSGAFRSMVKLTSLLQQEYGHNVIVVLPYTGSGKELLDDAGIQNVLIRSYDWTVKFWDRQADKAYCKNWNYQDCFI